MLTRSQGKKAHKEHKFKLWSMNNTSDTLSIIVSFMLKAEYKRATEASSSIMRRDLSITVSLICPGLSLSLILLWKQS